MSSATFTGLGSFLSSIDLGNQVPHEPVLEEQEPFRATYNLHKYRTRPINELRIFLRQDPGAASPISTRAARDARWHYYVFDAVITALTYLQKLGSSYRLPLAVC